MARSWSPGWALISAENGDVIISATVAHNVVTIVAKPKFRVDSTDFEGSNLLTFLRQESEKYEKAYPLEQHYELGDPTTNFTGFAGGGKGAKGANKGTTKSASSQAPQRNTDADFDPWLGAARRSPGGDRDRRGPESGARGGVRR